MGSNWWKRFRSHSTSAGRRRAQGRWCRPTVVPLEDRLTPTQLVALSTDNRLLAFDSAAPGTIQGVRPITGLPTGESVVGIDFQPATGQLYGLGSSSHLYLIDPTDGAATPVGTAFAVPLSGTAFGFAFDPVAGYLRVVSDTGQNMRVDPASGAVVDGDPNTPGIQPDTPLSVSGRVVEVAYTNDQPGATSTTLYGIDSASDMFVQVGGPDGNPSPNGGTVMPLAPWAATRPTWSASTSTPPATRATPR